MLRHTSFAFVYLDDILVASPDPETHKKNLRELFRLLHVNGININRKKCTFGKPEVKYLRHLVNVAGNHPLPDRVRDLENFPPPMTKLGFKDSLV